MALTGKGKNRRAGLSFIVHQILIEKNVDVVISLDVLLVAVVVVVIYSFHYTRRPRKGKILP